MLRHAWVLLQRLRNIFFRSRFSDRLQRSWTTDHWGSMSFRLVRNESRWPSTIHVSGEHADCHGSHNVVSCCQGHLAGTGAGPTDQCTWEYTGHGIMLECGRSDEVVVGRCGSGENRGRLWYIYMEVVISMFGLRLSWWNFSWNIVLWVWLSHGFVWIKWNRTRTM